MAKRSIEESVMAKKTAAKTKKKAPKKVGPNTLGCCTIVVPGVRNRSVPHVTRAQCTILGKRAGGVGQWNKGECA
jgi:hypothetical protein